MIGYGFPVVCPLFTQSKSIDVLEVVVETNEMIWLAFPQIRYECQRSNSVLRAWKCDAPQLYIADIMISKDVMTPLETGEWNAQIDSAGMISPV